MDELHTQGPIQAMDREPLIHSFPQHIFAQPESTQQSTTSNCSETRPIYQNDGKAACLPAVASGGGLAFHSAAAAAANGDNLSTENQPTAAENDINTDVYRSSPYFKYRNLVGSVSQKLRKENALRLAYVYDLPTWYYEIGPTYDPTSALRILIALEGKGVFSPGNLSGLTKALENVEREDLAHIVREFRRSEVAMETVARSNTFTRSRNFVGSEVCHGRPPKPVHSISTTSLMPVEDTNVFTDGKVYRSSSKPDLERHLVTVHGGATSTAVDCDLHQCRPLGHDKSVEIGLQFALMNLNSLQNQMALLNNHLTTTIRHQHDQNSTATLDLSHSSTYPQLQSILNNAIRSVDDSTRHIDLACSLVGASRLGSAGEPPLSARSTPVREFDHRASVGSSRKVSQSAPGGAVSMSRQSSGMSTKDKMANSFSAGVDARKQLSFDHSIERDGSSSSRQHRHGHSLYEKLPQEDLDCDDDLIAPHPGQMHATPTSSQVRIRRKWSRRDGKKLSRKGVLVWQIKVKKLKEWYSQKDISLDSEDFYDVCKRKFKATLHPFGLGDDRGSYMTLCINCLDEIKQTQKVPSTDIVVSVIDPQSSETPIQPISRQLERRGIRIIQKFISHSQVDKFLSDVIVVTIALKSEAPSDDSDVNEGTESVV